MKSIDQKSLKERQAASGHETGGDCFTQSGQLALRLPANTERVFVVHAEICPMPGTGPLAGIKHAHSWIEHHGEFTGAVVLDHSNGKRLTVDRSVFYRIAGLRGDERDNLKRYSIAQAHEWMRKTGHFGPWEINTEL